MKTNELHITIMEGPRKGEKYIFNKDRITLGRSRDCDLVFDDENSRGVSRVHAVIELTDNGWRISDNSSNGTYYFNTRLLKKASRFLLDNEIIRLSQKGWPLRITIVQKEKNVVRDMTDIPSPQPSGMSAPGLTKIIPLYRKGETERLRRNPIFWPGIATVVTGLLMFGLFQLIGETGNIAYVYLYELLLGIYLGSVIVFAIVKITGIKVKMKYFFAPALFTASTVFISISLLSPVFRTSFIMSFMESHNVVIAFIGHFIGAGLLEELIKSIPVWIAVIFAQKSHRREAGFKNGKLLPSLAVIIASSSAVGFIIVETVMLYVPQVQEQTNVAMGLMLLFPRFITGISGHVAWSGLFAYFISLAFNYKKKKLKLIATGWCGASLLHGLWNAFAMAEMPKSGAMIALLSFILFVVYINNTKNFE